MSPPCPQCGGRMRKRVNRGTRQAFWGCNAYPQCHGSLPWDWIEQGDGRTLDELYGAPSCQQLQAELRQVRLEYERLAVSHTQLLTEVWKLRQIQAPPPDAATLERELTRLIGVCHPDRWGGESRVATLLTQELLALRAKLQAGAGA